MEGGLQNSPKTLFSLGFVTGIVTLMEVACIFLPYWMRIDTKVTIGLFHSVNSGSSSLYETNCTDDMGELECSYVHSFQIAAVIAVLFGALSSLLYFVAPSYNSDLVSFFAVSGTLLQSIFGLIVFVLFLYFKKGYWDDDGINQEYDDVPGEDETHLLYGYWLWTSFNILNWLTVFGGYYLLYVSGYRKRGLLSI
eukprot:gene13232-14530_t